jgi:hypothetical protein
MEHNAIVDGEIPRSRHALPDEVEVGVLVAASM